MLLFYLQLKLLNLSFNLLLNSVMTGKNDRVSTSHILRELWIGLSGLNFYLGKNILHI